MSGRDTAASFKGLLAGLIFVGIVVVGITMLTNKKFEGHAESPAATTTP